MPHINIRCRASTKSRGDLVRMQKDGKIKLDNCIIEAMLATEMGFLSSLKGKKIKFNLSSLSKSKNLKENNENFVDFHLDIAKQVDKVINENEKVNNQQERQPETNINFVEIRKNWLKGPLSPEFKTAPQGNPIFNEVNIGEDLFEIVSSPEFGSNINREDLYEDTLVPTVEKTNNEECKNMLIDEEKQGSQKWLMGLGKIKIKSKDKPKKEIEQEKTTNTKNEKRNGYTTIKKDLENTKKELELKKKEIEEIEKLAKQKEEEFKKREEEKKKQEKLRKKELKKQEKLEKIKQKEKIKEEKRLLAEKKKKEKLEAQIQIKEEKRLLEEQKKKEKQRLEEQKKKEKLEAEQQLKEEIKKKESEKQVQTPEDKKDYDDLIETVAKKEIISDTKTKEKETEEQTEIKTKFTEKPEILDEDVRKALIIIDNLLEKLPDETIQEFVNSKDFAIYEKVVYKYKNK